MPADLLVNTLTYLGLIAAAISGVMEARRKDMDVVGACVVAFITALGGGTLRDMLLGKYPIFWIDNQTFAVVTFIVSLATFYSSRLLRLSTRAILIPDAIGLGMFSIIGADVALGSHTPLFAAALMGVVTGVFGGILRDIICKEIPTVFARSAHLYATCSLAGAVVYIGLFRSGSPQSFAATMGFLTVFGLRLLAVRYNLRLPDPF